MRCLYKSDYGAPDPSFDPLADGGRLISGFPAHARELWQAQNRGQLAAMERQLLRGEQIVWCDQGYGWVYQPAVAGFFELAFVLLILPWLVWRVLPRLFALRQTFFAAPRSGEP